MDSIFRNHEVLFDIIRNDLVESRMHDKNMADRILVEMVRFLQIKSKMPLSILSPPRLVNEAWHVAILNTGQYKAFCKDAFGMFIHHTTIVQEERNRKIEKAMAIYKIVFHQDPPEDIWMLYNANRRNPLRNARPKKRPKKEVIPKNFVDIFIKTATGRSITFILPETTTIQKVIEKLSKVPGIDHEAKDMMLCYGGRAMMGKESKTLKECNVKPKSILHLVFNTRGC